MVRITDAAALGKTGDSEADDFFGMFQSIVCDFPLRLAQGRQQGLQLEQDGGRRIVAGHGGAPISKHMEWLEFVQLHYIDWTMQTQGK